MKKLVITLALAAIAAVPAAAMQAQPGAAAPAQPAAATPAQTPQRQMVPQTLRGWLTFYNQPNYNGEDYETNTLKRVFRWDYNIRSIAIHPGDRWQICARPRFEGCIVLDRSVPDATMVGITASIGSLRPAPEDAPRQDNQ